MIIDQVEKGISMETKKEKPGEKQQATSALAQSAAA